MRRSVYFADAARDELVDLPVSCFLIEHPQGRVLFDTGMHPDLAVDAESRIGGMARMMRTISPPSDNVVESLARLGIFPDDIDLVVNSHLHTDHCGCNAFFRKATIMCHEREAQAALGDNAKAIGYFSVDWSNGPMQTFSDEVDLFGDGRVVLRPIPGHTPGSTGALVVVRKGLEFFLAADAASVEDNVKSRTIPRNTWDASLYSQSIEEIQRLRDRGVEILYGHDAPQWERLCKQPLFC